MDQMAVDDVIRFVRFAYGDVPPLGRKPSVLDGDFVDSWGCFPCDSGFFRRSDSIAKSFMERVESGGYGGRWTAEDKRVIFDEIESGQTILKTDSWWDTDVSFLERYYAGLSFIPPESFIFYTPAILTASLDGRKCKIGMASDFLLYLATADEDAIPVEFDIFCGDKKVAICAYMRLLMRNQDCLPSDVSRISRALEGPWRQFDQRVSSSLNALRDDG